MSELFGRELMKNGCNCAQSVLVTLSKEVGLDINTAMKISCGFGGGCRAGEICGAVTGALMAMGMINGNTDMTDKETREHAYAQYSEFNRRFREHYGTLICRELLGCDTSTPEGKKLYNESPELKHRCHVMVDGAIEIARDILVGK